MPRYWVFLTDPKDYHLGELFQKKKEMWDGVFGTVAQKYLSRLKKGDRIIGYHTAPDKAACAVLEAMSEPHQNPEIKDKVWMVGVRGVAKFERPVSLAEMKASTALKDMKLLRMFRPVAVTPLTVTEYNEIAAGQGYAREPLVRQIVLTCPAPCAIWRCRGGSLGAFFLYGDARRASEVLAPI